MKSGILILLLFCIETKAQNKENEYIKMVDSAITITYKSIFTSTKAIPSNGRPHTEDLYLIDEKDLPYRYSGGLNGIKFRTIDIFDDKNIELLKKGIAAWKIVPVLKEDSLTIGIIAIHISFDNKNYNYANGGGGETIFVYLCDEKKWKLIKSTFRGL